MKTIEEHGACEGNATIENHDTCEPMDECVMCERAVRWDLVNTEFLGFTRENCPLRRITGDAGDAK